MSGGPNEYPDITNKEPQVKEIRTEPPSDEVPDMGVGNMITSEQLKKFKGNYKPQPPTRFA